MCARISTYLHVFSRHLQMITKAETCISNNVHTLIALSNVACIYIYISCMYMFGFQVKNLKGTSISYLEESLEKEDQTLGRLESWVNHGEPKIASLSLVRQGFRYTEGGGWGEPGGTKWNQVEDMFGWPQLLSRHTSQCLKQPWQRTNMNTVCPTRTL